VTANLKEERILRKTGFAITILAISSLGLAACSGSGSEDVSNSADGSVDWFTTAGSEQEKAVWNHIADIAHEENPDITVNLTTAAWPDYWTKLPTVIRGNEAPCVAFFQMARLAPFADSLTPITDEMLQKAGVDLSDFEPSILDAMKVDDTLYALPYDLGPYIMYYNKDLLKEHGVAEPEDGWTVEDFVKAGKAVTGDGTWGFSVSQNPERFNAWLPTLTGGLLVNEEYQLEAATPAVEDALSWYAGLVSEDKIASPVSSSTQDLEQQAFLAGNAAMYVDGPWAMVNLKENANFDLGTVTMPVGPAGGGTVVGGSGFAIPKTCSNPDAAMKALASITGPDALNHLAEEGRAFPARTAEQNAWYENAVPGAEKTMEDSLTVATGYRATPTWVQDAILWQQGIVGVLNGDSTAEKFLMDFQSRVAG